MNWPSLASIIYFLFVLNLVKVKDGKVTFPQTPCRNVFNYKFRNGTNTNEVYGYLKFENDLTGDYQLEIRMSVARRIPGNIGISRLPTEDEIICGSDLEYEVSFPPCDGLIPLLTYVKFNNKIYCTGPSARDSYGRGTSNLIEFDGIVTDIQEDIKCEMPRHTTTTTTTTTRKRTTTATTPKITVENDLIAEKLEGCGILEEINGREHFPWLATIWYPNKNGTLTYRCSATLVSNSFALTVAHCLNHVEISTITIRAGRNNIKEIVPSQITTVRKVKTANIHPLFIGTYPSKSTGNIAILELDQPIEFTDLIRPPCLWKENEDLDKITAETAIVIGWGADAKPKKFTMPIVSNLDCVQSHEAIAKILDQYSFCAGFRNGSVPCVGNSGGSLLLRREGRYYLRGLTSNGLKSKDGRSCDGYSYNIFTDVAKFGGWISSIINK